MDIVESLNFEDRLYEFSSTHSKGDIHISRFVLSCATELTICRAGHLQIFLKRHVRLMCIASRRSWPATLHVRRTAHQPIQGTKLTLHWNRAAFEEHRSTMATSTEKEDVYSDLPALMDLEPVFNVEYTSGPQGRSRLPWPGLKPYSLFDGRVTYSPPLESESSGKGITIEGHRQALQFGWGAFSTTHAEHL